MRITNPTANFASRLLMNTSQRISKNLERLASGKRINRASDDVAGLGISKRMEARIEGMEMAAKNTQNAISLIQTAEAGLDEIHSMLKRVRELSVQGATGTISDSDREDIQKEVNELIEEINRIASSIQYNNINLFNSATGINGEAKVESIAEVITADAGRSGYTSPGIGGQAGEAVDINVRFPGRQVTRLDITQTVRGAGFEENVPSGEIIIRNAQTGWIANRIALEDLTIEQIMSRVSDIPGVKMSYDEDEDIFTIEYEGDIILEERPTPGGVGFFSAINISAYNSREPRKETRDGVDIVTTPTSSGYYESKGRGVIGRITSTNEVVSDRAASVALNQSINNAGFEVAPTGSIIITTGGRVYHFGLNSGYVRVYEVGTGRLKASYDQVPGVTNSYVTLQDIIDWLEKPVDYQVWSPGGRTYVLQPGPGLNVTYENDVFTITNEEEFMLDENPQYDTTGPGLVNFEQTGGEVGFFTAVNIPTLHGERYDETPLRRLIVYKEGIYKEAGPLRLTFHVGPDKDEVIDIDINEINTKTIGLTEKAGKEAYLDVSTREASNKAIELSDKAIDFISKERGKLGAIQNELQHRLNYLGVMEEQETASLSRIRDLDYAREMVEFTKNQILQMVGLGALVQASAMPRNVINIIL